MTVMKPSTARYCTISTIKPRRLSKPTFPQGSSLSIEPERIPQRLTERLPPFLRRYQDFSDNTFFQQVRKVIAARQTFDEICHINLVDSSKFLATNEAHRAREHRQQCAWNDWKMNLADLLDFEETKLQHTKPEMRDLKRHAQFKHILKGIRQRLESDAASESPRLSSEENREISLVLKFKDTEKGFSNCSYWNNRHTHLNCQKCGRFTECNFVDTRR